jgi:hypothetical protein
LRVEPCRACLPDGACNCAAWAAHPYVYSRAAASYIHEYRAARAAERHTHAHTSTTSDLYTNGPGHPNADYPGYIYASAYRYGSGDKYGCPNSHRYGYEHADQHADQFAYRYNDGVSYT